MNSIMEDKVWYPYSQMSLNTPRYKVVHAEKEFLTLDNGQTLIDGISSWWAAIHGYNHPLLNEALQHQAQQFSHIMLGGLTHGPVQELADVLVDITPKGLHHVFFSDSGSVAVEVALKMAIQFWSNQGNLNKKKFVSLHNAYHGDTFKTMEVGDDPDYQHSYQHVLNNGYYVHIPAGGFTPNDAQLQEAIDEFETLLQNKGDEIAAFIVEPLMQGAAGFQLYTPAYLTATKQLCEKYQVLFIADEVATGFGRTGKLFACEHAEISPDIMVLGKALTGGYLGHAATIASSQVYNAFLGETFEEAFMHGPTFMGNPLACAVSLKSFEVFQQEDYLTKVAQIQSYFETAFHGFEHEDIDSIRTLGCMIVIETKNAECLEGFKSYAIENNIWLRPIGKYLYTTPPYIISEDSLSKIVTVLKGWFLR